MKDGGQLFPSITPGALIVSSSLKLFEFASSLDLFHSMTVELFVLTRLCNWSAEGFRPLNKRVGRRAARAAVAHLSRDDFIFIARETHLAMFAQLTTSPRSLISERMAPLVTHK